MFCKQNCVHKDYCYYYSLRDELRKTKGIILCNQDLLTINLIKRNNYNKEILTDRFEFVVIDEAHNLESKVRSSFTMEMCYGSLLKTVERVGKVNRSLGNTMDKNIKEYRKLLSDVVLSLVAD
ncbi:hypothetical protein PNW90_12420 [[Ruminococcus] gnavus]|nr:hypothetical protein [Mediterraneibacter gnavus]MDB8711283.1 hypothetical protein [Mediterraneibacter gnavus]MDB8714550.1 hypothetical protein [Mediterraneibacter gnavus]